MKLSTYLVAVLAMVTLGLGVAACAERAATQVESSRLNLATMADCQYEDGTGADQAYPCKWDARTRGNGTWDISRPPVIVYADRSECTAWQLPSALAWCPSQGTVVTVAETYTGSPDVGPGDTLNIHMIPDDGMLARCDQMGGVLVGHVCRDVDF